MIKNEKYIKILEAMISCVSHGDYYSIKELSNLELNRMKKENKKIEKEIKKLKTNKKIRKNKDKPLENWNNEELIAFMNIYSQFIMKKIEETDNIEELQKRAISIEEFISKI